MEERVGCLKGYPDRKLSPANSPIKMSTGTAIFFFYQLVIPMTYCFVFK